MQIATIDIDESDGLKKKYEVTAIPTIIGFKKGTQANKWVGPMVMDSNADDFMKTAM